MHKVLPEPPESQRCLASISPVLTHIMYQVLAFCTAQSGNVVNCLRDAGRCQSSCVICTTKRMLVQLRSCPSPCCISP